MLELTGADPLNPVFTSAGDVIGVGHSTFVPSPDGSETWHVFHSKVDARSGWRRAISIQPVKFSADGFPDFGTPAQPRISLPVPAGQQPASPKFPLTRPLTEPSELREFSCYGHQQFMQQAEDGLDLGVVPKHPVNDYRSGEKLVLDDAKLTTPPDEAITLSVRATGSNFVISINGREVLTANDSTHPQGASASASSITTPASPICM